jgi:hypothetical protein
MIVLHRTSPELAQGGHLRHRSGHDSYLVVQRTRN